jgi:hypothetical protein
MVSETLMSVERPLANSPHADLDRLEKQGALGLRESAEWHIPGLISRHPSWGRRCERCDGERSPQACKVNPTKKVEVSLPKSSRPLVQPTGPLLRLRELKR